MEEDSLVFLLSIGILTLLLLYMTFIFVGEILCTFVTSKRNSAPKIAWRLFNFVETMKCVQKVVGMTSFGDKLNFKCAVPVIALTLLPVAVDNLIVVGVKVILKSNC